MDELTKVLVGVSTVLACIWAGFYVFTLDYDWYVGPMYLTLAVIAIPALLITLGTLEDMGII